MRFAHRPLRALVLLVTVFAAACGNDEADSRIFGTAFTLRDGAGQEATTFARGASITFDLSVRNRTASPQTIPFSSGQLFEFQVFPRDADSPLWMRSTGLVFTLNQPKVSLGPGERRSFSAVWDQIADDGAAIGAGVFEARGFLDVLAGLGVRPLEDPRVADVHALEFTVQ